MYHDFRVIDISEDLRNKTIEINFSFDIDPDSINEKTVSLVNRKTKSPVDYTYQLKPQAIILTLTEWPEPNTEYIIKISGLVNIIGDTLKEGGARRKLIFKSSLCSFVEIVSPAHEESVEKLNVQWRELLQDETHEYVNSYRIEIATDANFHYLEKELFIQERQEVLITGLEPRQYYVRGRVETKEEYGLWCEANGFIVSDCGCAADSDSDGEEDNTDEPIFEDDLLVLTCPANGTLPESFLIEFDGELSDDVIDNIILIRRDY